MFKYSGLFGHNPEYFVCDLQDVGQQNIEIELRFVVAKYIFASDK